MKQSTWEIPDVFSGDTAELEKAGYSRLLSSVLLARGLDTPEKAKRYLMRDEGEICDPFALCDMDKAVARLEKAVALHESVAVYGDYDVDGITASCLLCDCLSGFGIPCRIYIPDRIDEGYGLNTEALEALRQQGVSLVVTVDCGITAADNIAFANGIGLDIIITDHHECPAKLPECCAVINPKRHDASHPAYNLAGVGVALKLACALSGDTALMLERYCDLVAVGTIADVMPLTGENRMLVHRGLEKLRKDPRPGFSALLHEAGAAEKPITASVVGYTLAPRINAAGRLCQTSSAVDLLMCGDLRKAQEIAAELCTLNRRRQELETQVWRESAEALEADPPHGPIVLASERWHQGVVGIAASRLAEEYRLPAIIICLDGDNGKGSCRSFGEFNLFDGLDKCREHLESFGGHAFAAGLNIKRDNIDAFRAALSHYYAENTPEEHVEFEPELQLPDLSSLTIENVESLDEMEPCGSGNPKPLMCLCSVVIDELSAIGGGKHLRMGVSKNGQSVSCVFFSQTLENLAVAEGDIADLCFTPQINDYRSRRNIQLLIAGVRPAPQLELCREILEKPGELPEEAESMWISRDELGKLWRSLRSLGGRRQKLTQLITGESFEDTEPEKICLGICIFAELDLLTVRFDGAYIEIKINENGDKAQLEDSQLFCRLSQNRTAE